MSPQRHVLMTSALSHRLRRRRMSTEFARDMRKRINLRTCENYPPLTRDAQKKEYSTIKVYFY